MEKEKSKRDLKNLDTRELGFLAEGIARHYLINKNYEILAANYKLKFGELDIIARKENVITFFEVKALKRSHEGFEPEMRVDYEKKNKLINLAAAYMLNNKMTDTAWQIDIISVIFDLESKKVKIKHFKNAIND